MARDRLDRDQGAFVFRRFEYYDLNSEPDALFTRAFPNAEIVDLDTTAWAPRVGLVWPVIEKLDLFFQFARGFRSPPFEDVNIGLDIPQFGIRAIPNPDWEIRFITTATRSQRRLVDEQGNPLFSAPGSTVFDLTGRWQITPDVKLSAGIFNLTDKHWFSHANVINRPVGDPTLPLLAEPGTNVRGTLSWQF